MVESQKCEWEGKYGRCKTHIRYHIIFVAKYRRKCLDGIRDQVFEAFKQCEANSHLKIHNMNIDKDHIHLLISFPVDYSISQTINRLKQYTTNYLYRKEDTYKWLKQFYCKKKCILWTNGYFVSTIGQISEEIVFKYIENQGK